MPHRPLGSLTLEQREVLDYVHHRLLDAAEEIRSVRNGGSGSLRAAVWLLRHSEHDCTIILREMEE